MINKWKQLLSALLAGSILFTGLMSCAVSTEPSNTLTAESGFGGTGIILFQPEDEDSSGFGGTGILSKANQQLDESGFGGTGIVGNIEAFGSIWVNGIEIDYDNNVTLLTNVPGIKPALKIGQTVILETGAELNTAKRPVTETIQIYYAFAGPITAIEKSRIQINQQWLEFNDQALKDEGVVLKKGTFVAVNAVQNDQHWTVKRFDNNPENISQTLPSIDVQFSQQVKQILVDENLQFMHQQKIIKNEMLQNMKRLRINREQWNHIHHERSLPRHLKPEFNNRPVQQELRNLRDIRESRHHLPPPIIQQQIRHPIRNLPIKPPLPVTPQRP